MRTKNVIQSAIAELNQVLSLPGLDEASRLSIQARKNELEAELASALDDIHKNILRSHQAICEAKKMGEKEAYGHNPTMYYILGISAECGEMANAVVRAVRNGWDEDKAVAAVRSELADVIIYSYILAHVNDIDLTELVNEKVEIVINRAKSGYYGNKLH